MHHYVQGARELDDDDDDALAALAYEPCVRGGGAATRRGKCGVGVADGAIEATGSASVPVIAADVDHADAASAAALAVGNAGHFFWCGGDLIGGDIGAGVDEMSP